MLTFLPLVDTVLYYGPQQQTVQEKNIKTYVKEEINQVKSRPNENNRQVGTT